MFWTLRAHVARIGDVITGVTRVRQAGGLGAKQVG
jgi:hypothetical protein